MPTYPAAIKRVIDGDTLDVDVTLTASVKVDVGLETTLTATASEDVWVRLRLNGLNAPEKNTPEGKAAIAFVNAWIAQHPGPYTLTTLAGDRKEKYGRTLATLTAADGAVLNQDLLDSGNAQPYDGTGPRP
jgi:endonuclease YncB( thermonuclease family)